MNRHPLLTTLIDIHKAIQIEKKNPNITMSDLQKSPASPRISIESPTKPIEISSKGTRQWKYKTRKKKRKRKKKRQHLQSTIDDISKDQSKHS